MAKSWEDGFQSSVKTLRRGWNITNNNGRMLLRIRGKGLVTQTANLPFGWNAANQGDALLLINRIYDPVHNGEKSLKLAIKEALGLSDKLSHKVAKGWDAIAQSLFDLRTTGVNQIKESTWKDNWQPYIEEGTRILKSGSVTSGHELLEQCLKSWEGKPSSRAACCLALKNFTEHAVVRHNMPASWMVTQTSIKELRGRTTEKRTKAVLEDQELLDFIDAINERNHAWANVIRTLALFGMRPIELQYLTPRIDEYGVLRVWCSYSKVSGPNKSHAGWLVPVPLESSNGQKVQWDIPEELEDGSLQLPIGRNGEFRKLNGRFVLNFLQVQPEWIRLKQKYEKKGLWLRPYTFRDSYSSRCHRYGMEYAQICRAMRHSESAHSRAYRTATDKTMFDAFDQLN